MSTPFQFTVTDTFLIEGRGLILSPFFALDTYQFDGKEHVRVETPSGRLFEADADVEIPYVTPRPKVFQAMFVIRAAQKDDIPVGSKVTLPDKTAEQVAAPNGGPTTSLGNSGVTEGPPSVS
jgi:hypothetical protein